MPSPTRCTAVDRLGRAAALSVSLAVFVAGCSSEPSTTAVSEASGNTVEIAGSRSPVSGPDQSSQAPAADAPAGQSGEPTSTSTTADTIAPNSDPVQVETTVAEPPARSLAGQFGVRYCEVLGLTLAPDETIAEVWGTQGLNDCPADRFAALDPAELTAALGVTAALINGPRHWVLDRIVANNLAGSGEIRPLGGIDMRSIAFVELGAGLPTREPLTERSVRRDTEFVFDAGREVYELTDPDGSIYIMQSYSLQIEPSLTVADLAGLGTRLQLPDGWTFAARVLDGELVVEDIDGEAVVIQDELQNSYQLRLRG